MNTIIQNIIAFSILTAAVVYLIQKFLWTPKSKKSKSCGNDNCGCS